MSEPLPQWATDILSAVPSRGQGLNVWLLRAAIALRRCERTPHEIQATLETLTAGEPVKPGEIVRAVARSANYLSDGQTPTPQRKWGTMNEQLRQKIIDQSGGFGAVELWEKSPYRLVDDGPCADECIDLLFPGNPLLCCAATLPTAHTAPRESWRGKLDEMQFIVPSAMSELTGRTQEGRESPRCSENTGPRQYMVVEQDVGSTDEQAAVLWHMAQNAPMVLVVMSGNKSLHAWFACRGVAEPKVRAFFNYAVMLGADPMTWTRCQLVRMPEGRRDNGRRQAVIFVNTEVLP